MSCEYQMTERKLSLLWAERTCVTTVPASGAMGYDEDRAKDGLGQDTLPTGFAVET